MTFDLNQSIGDSVTQHPELVKVYMHHGVDFCCGGQRSIREALETDAADAELVIQEAQQAMISASEFNIQGVKLSDLSNAQLIDKIIGDHHTYLKAELPVISELLFKLLMVHGNLHPELFAIHKLYGELRLELEAHLVKEETLLFPGILADQADIKDLIKTLEDEHDGAGEALHQLTDLTDHFKLPEGACRTYAIVYDKLKTLVSDMYIHVHSENNVLFKRLQ